MDRFLFDWLYLDNLINFIVLYFTSGTFPASPGSFLKKICINMTIDIIHILSNVT